MEQKELLIKYYEKLINNIYKCLPIIEGLGYKTKKVVYTKEEAYKNYQIYINNLLIEIYGHCELFFCSDNSIKLASTLKGMICEDNHSVVKRLTMSCIKICKDIIKEIERE